MIPLIETVKADKKKKENEHVLATDGSARIVFSPEDGQVEEFVVGAVNPIHWHGVLFNAPLNAFGLRMDSAREMEWHIFVTDTRLVFWSPSIVTMTGAAKTVPGKATAGQFHYHDFSWIGYGRSSFEEGRALLDAKDDHKDKTQAAGGLLTVSIVRIDDATRPAQAVATVEAEGPVLAGIVGAVAERVKNLSIPESNWSDAVSILREVDFEKDDGLVIVNPSLSEHAPIDRWFQFNLSVTFEVDTGAANNAAPEGKRPCSGCGEMIEEDNGFCPMCGRQNPFAGAGQEGNVFCTNCGSPLAEGTRFCGKCGAPASGAAPPPAYANQYPPQAAPVAAQPKKTSKLIIERRRGSGLVFDKSSIWSWDVLIDGKRVDALYDTGSKVTIERDEGFICFLRCNNDIYQETNELRIPVATGQTKQVAVIYKKALFGWTFETVPW